jgi:hypothetical protein
MASAPATLRVPPFLSWREQRWPRAAWARWGLRLAVAVPYVALADLANARGGASAANLALSHQAQALTWTSGRLDWVAHAYPPLPLALARVVPGGAFGLAVAGALCTGVLLQLTVERLILRSVPTASALVLAASVAVMPVFWFVAVRDVVSFLTLSLLSAALTGLLDFMFNRSTESGFIAGIGFGLATLCDLSALSFAVAGAVAAVLVAPRARAVREIARRRAAATVVLFPSAAALVGWSFLEWRFSGSWTRSFTLAEPGLFRFVGGAGGSLVRSANAVGIDLLFAPVFIVAAALVLTRRPSSFLSGVAVLGCLIADGWLGAALGRPATVVLLAVVGLALLPEHPSRLEQGVLWVAVALQVAAAFGALDAGLGPVTHWLHRLAVPG